MSDEAILEMFNDMLRAQGQLAAEYKHIALEVPFWDLEAVMVGMVVSFR